MKRRSFLGGVGAATLMLPSRKVFSDPRSVRLVGMQCSDVKKVDAGVLAVAYEEHGPPNGDAVVLLHGFPYDTASYAGVAARLAAAGRRVIVPYLRGYGPTRFLSADAAISSPSSIRYGSVGRRSRVTIGAAGRPASLRRSIPTVSPAW